MAFDSEMIYDQILQPVYHLYVGILDAFFTQYKGVFISYSLSALFRLDLKTC